MTFPSGTTSTSSRGSNPPVANAVVIDTSAWYAIVSSSDKFHESAVRVFNGLIDGGASLMTTSYVLAETVGLVQRRLGRQVVLKVGTTIPAICEIIWVEERAHALVWREVQRSEARLSLVDWSCVVTARTFRCPVFAFDSDFKQTGIRVIPEL